MTMILRAVVSVLFVVLCAGFVPISGCAKGCGRVARSGGDDLARAGGNYGDDLARGYARNYGTYADDLARGGTYRPGGYRPGGVVIPGGVGDDLAHVSRAGLDDAISALPEVEGGIHAYARKPTANELVLDGLDDTGRTFGKDYAKAIDDLSLSKDQHDKLMDVFEKAQDLAQDVVESLLESDDDDPAARVKLQVVALELSIDLGEVLTPEQQEQFRTHLGSPEVVAYRLGKDRPVKRKAEPKTKTKAKQKPGKTAGE